jgi:beta-glucanase (GH16 family)
MIKSKMGKSNNVFRKLVLRYSSALYRFILNLTRTDDGDGSCTADETSLAYKESCSIRSNITSHAIIPSVRSARLTTEGSKSILYGRVEVTAKLPQGDWLWPAIWMMPEDSVYGIWPLSGEIDIMESRGNQRGPSGYGRETFLSTLHWGQDLSC